MNAIELQRRLEELDYYIDDKTLYLFVSALEVARGAFLKGHAGVGKTSLVENCARILGAELVYFQCYPSAREEDFLYRYEPDESTKSGFRLREGVLVEAVKKSKERKVFLLIDELDKSHPSADAFFLDFLQNKRIRFKGELLQANGNLYTFFTLNYERELSEPLLRRLPVIEIPHLPASLVKKVLSKKHPDNPYIDLAVKLYIKTIKAGLYKPATIQELSQFLRAIEVLKDKADFDSLVYAYITKTEEQHRMLAEGKEEYRENRAVLDVEKWEEKEEIKVEEKVFVPRMPRVKYQKQEPTEELKEEELEKAGGVLKGEYAYDCGIRLMKMDPSKLEDRKGETVVLKESIDFLKFDYLSTLEKVEGELEFYIDNVSKDSVKYLLSGWHYKKYSDDEIIAFYDTVGRIDLRWKDGRIEFIVSTKDLNRVLELSGLNAFKKQLIEKKEKKEEKVQESIVEKVERMIEEGFGRTAEEILKNLPLVNEYVKELGKVNFHAEGIKVENLERRKELLLKYLKLFKALYEAKEKLEKCNVKVRLGSGFSNEIEVEVYTDYVLLYLPHKKGKAITPQDIEQIIQDIDKRIEELRREL